MIHLTFTYLYYSHRNGRKLGDSLVFCNKDSYPGDHEVFLGLSELPRNVGRIVCDCVSLHFSGKLDFPRIPAPPPKSHCKKGL